MNSENSFDSVVLTVTPKSKSGLSIYRDIEQLCIDTLSEFTSPNGAVDSIIQELQSLDVCIEAFSEVGLTISLEVQLAKKLFGCDFIKRRNRFISEFYRSEIIADGNIDFSTLKCAEYIECISIPKGSFELSLERPVLDYHIYAVPEQVAQVAGATGLNAAGFNGDGVKVAIIDTGLWEHPHFSHHNYKTSVFSAVSLLDAARDERGHGTAMSSVTLSIAPSIDLTMIKMCDGKLSYPVAALQKAVEMRPHIINCSWGTIGYEPAVHLEIVNALAKGIQVIFSSGNGSTDKKEAMFQSIAPPDCLTIGGVYIDENEIEVSGVSSSYQSDVYEGRNVPDMCGICGHLPSARLILFPTEPGSEHDLRNGQTDGTGGDDGWLVSSGTSAAAAWVTGHLALILQQNPSMSLSQQRASLQKACIKVSRGVSNSGDAATGEANCPATGSGVVHGSKVVLNPMSE
ncbi:S8 family serine peptidase [Spartinivicinus poritis]|uniref:S8 family serine peptidase n=1 Tax=Spartinivicinus poritis TaxID=2994640 RepID=A0ABT5U808_9GAMM|nr:S8 family serine peptidase [Spartinivicinus sp. A2-2]MDE1462516.1 S8 family serine peptidase [Spartinivicinus sp. A2-2]